MGRLTLLGAGSASGASAPAAWSPNDLSGLAATVLPALSRQQGKLWQNAAKTTPATANGDPVRVAVCPFTAVEFTAASDARRPLLNDEGGGLWSLLFDGVDDYLSCSAAGATGATLDADLTIAGRWYKTADTNVLLLTKSKGSSPYRDYFAYPAAVGNLQTQIYYDAVFSSHNAATPISAYSTNAWNTSYHGWTNSTTKGFVRLGKAGTLYESAATATPNVTDAPLVVGADLTFGPAQFWVGMIAGLVVCRSLVAGTTLDSLDDYLTALTP